jgi:aspartate racemase
VKTIGLIGGMSWESSAQYYRVINEEVKARLGGYHSARLILYSIDFDDLQKLQHAGDWERAGAMMASAARALEAAGAECVVVTANTMHKSVPQIESAVSIPVLHIADATAEPITKAGLTTVGLLATRFTMEQEFYRERLEHHGLRVLVPEQADRDFVHEVIYEELCQGRIVPASREEYRRIIDALVARGAQAIILGCTEISLLISQRDTAVPVFDTMALHARKAVDWSLAPA